VVLRACNRHACAYQDAGAVAGRNAEAAGFSNAARRRWQSFHPNKRTVHDEILRLGFVGRITPEKGVRLFLEIERALEASGYREFQILFVGDGSEVTWLRQNLKHGEFLGVLSGEDLARAYANMDWFVFPSKTDTFGNVIQESAASQVAAVVTNEGGPQDLVVDGVTGHVAQCNDDFIRKVVELCGDRGKLQKIGAAAREKVYETSWDNAFEMCYKAYRHCLPENSKLMGHLSTARDYFRAETASLAENVVHGPAFMSRR
jgi:phosphatidylinositol alpha 1,6-mannosyltransferase